MTDQDYRQFAVEMGSLSVAFRVEPSLPLFKLYHKHLSNFSLDAVVFAINKIIDTGEKFPAVAQIRAVANSYRPPVRGKVPQVNNILAEFTGTEMEKYQGMESEEIFKAMLKETVDRVSA